jgi:putative FmdB family regulatory protein
MPLFEYLCKDCGKAFEKIVPRYDSPAACLHCNSSNVEKQLSVFAVAGSSQKELSSEAGCGTCGAPQPGMCGMMD